jgi:hypothetical protein
VWKVRFAEILTVEDGGHDVQFQEPSSAA